MILVNKPWYREEHYTEEAAANIHRSILICEADRRQTICDAALAQFAYERERWRYQYSETLRGAGGSGFKRYLSKLEQDDPALNQIKSLTDKFVADMLQATPGLTVQTSNGRYEDIVQDKIRSRLLQGMLDRTEFRHARRRWIRQGILERVGWIWPSYRGHALKATQLQQYQVYFDGRAAIHKDPPDMHVVELWDRHDLVKWYEGRSGKVPDRAERIGHLMSYQRFPPAYQPLPISCAWMGAYRATLTTQAAGDTLRVVHSWKKSSKPGDPSGRQTVTVMGSDVSSSMILIDKEYDRDSFPIVWWTPWETAFGIDGVSIADSMIVTDCALAIMVRRINQMMLRHGSDKLIMPRKKDPALAAQYLAMGFDVIWDDQLETADGLPQHYKPYTLQESELKYMDFLMSRPTGLLGQSEQQLQGTDTVSPGASGIARLQSKFQATGRHLSPIDAYTTSHRALGDQAMNAVDDALDGDPSFRASYMDGSRIVTKPWSQYAIAREDRRVVITEVGTLGADPAGQIQTIEQLVGTGQLPQEAAAHHLASQADVQRLVGAVFAPREAIQRHISVLSDPRASEEWPEAQPTEDMDLDLAIRLTTQAINAAIAHDAEAETISRLRGYSIAAQATKNALAPPDVAPAQLPPMQ